MSELRRVTRVSPVYFKGLRLRFSDENQYEIGRQHLVGIRPASDLNERQPSHTRSQICTYRHPLTRGYV